MITIITKKWIGIGILLMGRCCGRAKMKMVHHQITNLRGLQSSHEIIWLDVRHRGEVGSPGSSSLLMHDNS